MRHTSDAINADLGKLSDGKAAEIRRVASSDTRGTSILGANRPVPVRDWVRKIARHREVSRPDPKAPPR